MIKIKGKKYLAADKKFFYESSTTIYITNNTVSFCCPRHRIYIKVYCTRKKNPMVDDISLREKSRQEQTAFLLIHLFFAVVSMLTYVGWVEGKALEEAKISDNDRNSKLT